MLLVGHRCGSRVRDLLACSWQCWPHSSGPPRSAAGASPRSATVFRAARWRAAALIALPSLLRQSFLQAASSRTHCANRRPARRLLLRRSFPQAASSRTRCANRRPARRLLLLLRQAFLQAASSRTHFANRRLARRLRLRKVLRRRALCAPLRVEIQYLGHYFWRGLRGLRRTSDPPRAAFLGASERLSRLPSRARFHGRGAEPRLQAVRSRAQTRDEHERAPPESTASSLTNGWH
jgi:hypothetical protein